MKKSSSFHFLNNLLRNNDTPHFPLDYWCCEPRWVCHTALIFYLEYEKKIHCWRYVVINLPKRDFFTVWWLLLSSVNLNFWRLSLWWSGHQRIEIIFGVLQEWEVSRTFGFKYFFPWLLSSQAIGQHGEQGRPSGLLSPLWTVEQPKQPLKGESPRCLQVAQMPENSLLLRSWAQLGHPHNTGSKLHWVSMGSESSLGYKKLGFGSMNILWVQFFRLLVGNFAVDFIRDLSWCSLGHFLGFTRWRQDCG